MVSANETGVSSSLMGHLAQMQTVPFTMCKCDNHKTGSYFFSNARCQSSVLFQLRPSYGTQC